MKYKDTSHYTSQTTGMTRRNTTDTERITFLLYLTILIGRPFVYTLLQSQTQGVLFDTHEHGFECLSHSREQIWFDLLVGHNVDRSVLMD